MKASPPFFCAAFFLVSICFIILFFNSFALADSADIKMEKVTLQLKWTHQFQFAGYYAAIDKGFYRDKGLDVNLLEAEKGVEPASSVVSGKADYGIATSDLLLMRSKGYPVVALAPIFQHSALAFLATSESGIESIHDLVGKKVMMEFHSDELNAYLEQEKVPVNRIKFVPHTFDVKDLLDKRVDAMSTYMTVEPFILRKAGVRFFSFSPRSGGLDFYGDTLFTLQTEIDANPERVKAFVEASVRGWSYAMSHTEEIIDLITRVYDSKADREQLRFEAEAMQKLVLSDVVEVGYMNPGRWRYIAETYAKMGMIPDNFSLKGFLWEKDPAASLFWYYASFAAIFLCLAVVSFIAIRFSIMNRTIKYQVESLEKTGALLNEAKKRYRSLLDNAPFPIAIVRYSDSSFFYVNILAAQSLKIDINHAVGKNISQFYNDSEDRKKLCSILDVAGFVRNFEVRFKRTDGELFWVSLSAAINEFNNEKATVVAFVDITEKRMAHEETKKLVDELQVALANVKTLGGLLPICSGCKKIRDDKGYWNQLEAYISSHSGAMFSHGLCPDCVKSLYPDLF